MRRKNHMFTRVDKALFIGKVGYQKKIGSFSQKGERVESNQSNKRRKFKIKCFYYKKLSHMIKDCKKKIADEKQNK
jgi:hypothetical protein